MNSVIYSLFISLALRMSVITLFIMLIKLIFRQKLSAAAHCAIWIIPCVQTLFCVCNVRIPSEASIYNVVRSSAAQPAAEVYTAAAMDAKNIIAAIYAAGAVLTLLWYVSVFVVHCCKVYSGAAVCDIASQNALYEIRTRLKIKKNITLKQGSYAHTIMNTVILPNGYSKEEQWQIILHELCHYKHKDNLKLWTGTLVIVLNWFNPIVWAAFKQFRRDIEMYCDESVIKLTSSRKEYARVLVKTASDKIRFIPGASGAANGTHEVAMRVKRIAAWRRKNPIWIAAALLACLCAVCLCLTDAVTAAVESTTEVSVTPEPVEVVPAIMDVVTATEQPAPVTEKADEPTAVPVRESVRRQESSTDTTNTQVQSEAAVSSVTEAMEGEKAEDSDTDTTQSDEAEAEPEADSEELSAPSQLGDLTDVSANGSKETYEMEDGRTAVLQYNDGSLETGYIINKTPSAEQSQTKEPLDD